MTERKLVWLEAMRGFAAIWVLLHHAEQSVSHFVGSLGEVPLISNGFLGVDFFFILSGFIIAYSSHRLAMNGGGLKTYFRARLVRIYVPYLPVGGGMFLLYLLLPGLSASERIPGLLTSITLAPSNSPPALAVAWTLVHEMIFYIAFSVFFLSRRLFWLLMLAWAAGISVTVYNGPGLSRFENYFLSPLNLYFLLGIGLFWLRRWTAPSYLVGLAALAGVMCVFVPALAPTPDRLMVGIGFGLLVMAAASPHAARLEVPRLAAMLGTASYAIYLIHGPIIGISVRAFRNADPWLALCFVSVIALLAGIAYWFFYERHALRAVKNFLADRKPPVPATVSHV